MEFSEVDIQEVLKHSLPKRFQDISPTDFEGFIAQLFSDLGFDVEQTPYSGDFGADLIVRKFEKCTTVQVKRYADTNKVGVHDVNQIIGAKAYYKCDMSMIITTSDFTNPALRLIEEVNIKKWNWDDLHKNIRDTYLDGKDIYAFFPELITNIEEGMLELEITKIDYNIQMETGGLYTLMWATLTNRGPNTHISLALPIIITQENRQFEAAGLYKGYFASGTVYSGSSVEVAFMFMSEQLDKVSVGDRIIFNIFGNNDELSTYETKVNMNAQIAKPSTYEAEVSDKSYNGCYVTTLCYGKESREYLELTYFRDNFLLKHSCGRIIVSKYYKYGGILISVLQDSSVAKFISRVIIKLITIPIIFLNLYLKKHA